MFQSNSRATFVLVSVSACAEKLGNVGIILVIIIDRVRTISSDFCAEFEPVDQFDSGSCKGIKGFLDCTKTLLKILSMYEELSKLVRDSISFGQ